jgi:large repetitive protein
MVTLLQHTSGVLFGDTNLGGTGNVLPCRTGMCGVFYSFKIGLGPFVTFLSSQSAGKVGKVIGILGQGFTGTTAVKFNGTAAPFTVVSSTYLTATVPSGATSGAITVTTPGGTLKSNKKFQVIPQITSFSPGSGAPGTAVTITGISLKQTTKVTFGGVAATFTVNSDTEVTAIVPSGAVTGKITITTSGGTAQSATTFTVT